MRAPVLFLLLLTACFSAPEQMVAQGASAKKQKQRISTLQKKLELAEKERLKVQSEVEQLALEIDRAQLALIRKQLDKYEQKKEKTPSLFLEEREVLYRMIQSGASPSSFEAQVELDRILRIITALSDEKKSA